MLEVTTLKKLDNNNNNIDEKIGSYSKLVNNEVYEENMEIINHYLERHEKKRYIFENEQTLKILKICKNVIKDKKKYISRLCKEFKLIDEFGFHNVFLQVCEILYLSRDVPHIIRGSAGSCLLCYLLGITDIDPIKENITLSRFMHKKRNDIPDIDIDFPAHLRDDIYKKIFENWEGKVARISNHIMYAKKSAFREAISGVTTCHTAHNHVAACLFEITMSCSQFDKWRGQADVVLAEGPQERLAIGMT